MSKRKICVVTGTRAEYGLLSLLMKGIQQNKELDLQIIATGMHLSPEFGLTFKEIEKDGFEIDHKIEMLLSADTASAISKSTGLGIIGLSDAYSALKPDIIVVLGDRYEVLAASIAALFARIPLAHIHGGETTVGAYDEAIRHSITKMATWHFAATDTYSKRVIQLGESPSRVSTVGGLGVEAIQNMHLLDKSQIEKRIDFKFGRKNLLITFHSVTQEVDSSERQFKNLLACFSQLKNTKMIFTKANSDTNGRIINQLIDAFVAEHTDSSIAFNSMGQLNYFSSMQYVDAVVGNSSSGLLEAPSFRIATINIGDRQKGRVLADSVINCIPTIDAIMGAIDKVYSKKFTEMLRNVKNPYDGGNPSKKIVEHLKKIELPINAMKDFYDL
jgi:GDP/UDP-N,N'-diacetylbacillosamine 2-epimerase (hydrolysing)